MQPEQLVLPALATAALGTALFAPLREGRTRGRGTRDARPRATRSEFRAIAGSSTRLVTIDWYAPLRSIAKCLRDCLSETPRCDIAPSAADDCAQNDAVIERSFVHEVAQLLLPEAPDDHSERADDDPITVTQPRRPLERVVPLTRLPLRPQPSEITWPRLLDVSNPEQSRSGRQALLRQARQEPEIRHEAALVAAYREEDADGRLLALQALLSGRFSSARELFADALRIGSDDERSFAVDALLACGDRDALCVALCDRLDAIAARAALGYVASNARADYVERLAPLLDPARLETVLSLLAGIVE